ncbi:bi-domain-containing oxidoreductase [Gammaproteobacteria bacterium]|nr:bi-domain-containing oxidoreductase [Gammaproteobacteria bacterium]MDC1108215.1 bi-domain-containing oxidoreductase [Gammaproteobacteria bacterium]
MKQLLQDLNTGLVTLTECPAPILQKDSLKISTNASLISAGTERMLADFAKASYIDKARQQPEKVKMVLDKISSDGLLTTVDAVRSKLSQPMPLGYSNVGVVHESSNHKSNFQIGDRVVSNGSHADVVVVKEHLCARIPDNVDDDSAVFTVIGSIALQGVRLAKPTIGECFVVSGVGLVGLLTVQILKANGCEVLAVDYDQDKLKLASQFGAQTCNLSQDQDILGISKSFSHGRGVDGVIIAAASKSNDVIKQAAQISRKRGRVILVGVVGLNLDRNDFYEKEITFQVSCSYGPGRYDPSYEEGGNDYPIAFVRWTEQRNFEAFLRLLANKSIDVKPLISAIFNFSDASDAYEELTENRSALGILLDYGSNESDRMNSSIALEKNYQFNSNQPVLGFIGAGNYASRVLIPAFKKNGGQLHTLVSANGVNSSFFGKKENFKNASTDIKAILADPQINTVVIATRHDTHAKYSIESLMSGMNVWVEKPLAITIDELSILEDTYKQAHEKIEKGIKGPQLMVGFNRRFSPHAIKMHQLLSNIQDPKKFLITVNAGFIPGDHWTQDPFIGGGRIIGECCHYIDLLRFLVGAKATKVFAKSINVSNAVAGDSDSASITLEYEDGSSGTIMYLTNGANNFPKERVEVFTGGKVLQLDNFRRLRGYGWNNFKKMNFFSQDKGQNACARAFLEGIKLGSPCIPAEEIFEVSRMTIEASNMLHQK